MRFATALLFALAGLAHVGAAAAGPTLAVREIRTPAGERAAAPNLVLGPGGVPFLTWTEPGLALGSSQLRLAHFDAASDSWTQPSAIARDVAVAGGGLSAQIGTDRDGSLYAGWIDGHGVGWMARSADGGVTWASAQPWLRRHSRVDDPAVTRLADGRMLAVWCEGAESGAGAVGLNSRLGAFDAAADQHIDPSVNPGSAPSLVALLDGGALLAYRGRNDDEARDIQIARFRHGAWEPGHVLNVDDWRSATAVTPGPRLATDGSRVAAAWFTGADNDPRLLASYSPDAGTRWLMPLRVDRGHPAGAVDTVLLRDGAFVVVWIEKDGGVWLRRISPEFNLTEPLALAPAGTANLLGAPRAVLARDYVGGLSHASVLVAYPQLSGIRTVAIDLPEGELVTAERNCDCAPTLEQLQGFSLRGRVVAIDAARHTVQVAHAEVPGVFDAGTHVFALAPSEFSALAPGREFLGRIDRHDAGWRLFDLRYLATPTK